ncbi:hypothetical protein O3V59_05820 [Brevibacillus thermoruber]|uniref:Uncharacterized protein n=1 Tax=Brevibacillus thermoruber TaxID=33942 RepID=A0A9X3Z2K4_9BACL|nr:hypothetical protein [Brevibacillus thermoruber]MDA5107867.1 hypothetical protein [Brevibacillus thermoruber]
MSDSIITEVQIENALNYMDRYIQKKHLLKIINKWKIKNRTRNRDMFDDIIRAVQFNLIPLDEFRSWLSQNQIDGNNYHFIYDVDFLGLKETDLEKLTENQNIYTINILDINKDNLEGIALVHVFKLENRYVLSFLAKGQISKKKLVGDGTIKVETENIVYPAFVEFDFNNNNVIVVLNPTANLVHVNGIQLGKYNDFSPIADEFLKETRKRIGTFYVKKPRWITYALHSLAEEATYHNNPEVESRSIQAQEIIEDFARQLLEQNDITDVALIDSFAAEIQSAFVMILQEQFQVITSDSSIGVFLQKTDQARTTIELEGKGQNLNIGTPGRIARQCRQDSDLKILGIDIKMPDENRYRFKIEDGKDHILIRPNNNFTEEEVVQYVLSKLHKHKATALLK